MRLFPWPLSIVALVAALTLAACTPERTERPVSGVAGAGANTAEPVWLPRDGQPIRWRALLVGGDNSEAAFYNAAHAMARMLRTAGVAQDDIVVLSAYEKQRGLSSDFASLTYRASQSKVAPGDGCIVFMTAHGSQGGLRLRGDNSYYTLSPSALDGLLRDYCRQAPTVVITSACYSGVFAQAPMPAPNRVIYTAARRDRTSFGCDSQLEFTYFDYCLLSSLPQLKDWQQLASRTSRCVSRREAQINVRASEPQFVLGEAMRELRPPPMPLQAVATLWEVVPRNLAEANALPFGGGPGQRGLSDYKAVAGAKALAVGPTGGWAWIKGDSDQQVTAGALEACRRKTGNDCLLYAVGNRLVWHQSVEARLQTGTATALALLQAD